MTVSYDAFSSNTSAGYATSHTHTPAGTPRGVIVFVQHENVTAVSYGGQPLVNVGASTPQGAGGFPGAVTWCWFLGAGLPSGPQSVVVTGPGAGEPTTTVVTVAAAADVEPVDFDSWSTAAANPTVTLSAAGRSVFAALSAFSGQGDTAGITPFANWTARQEEDYGAFTQLTYTYNTIATADVSAGWTQTSEEANGFAIAVSEVVSGGGGTELVVGDCAHGHTVDSPSLTQANTLAVADALHSHAADNLVLVQSFTLSVAEAVHAHSVDAPTLTQANVLAVADSVHAHAADSPVLSQSQLLTVGDSVHAIVTEALELTQAHVLAVESAVHAHIADGVDLSTSGSLGVGSSAHGHAVDQPELVQAAILTIGDSVHALVSAQIVLSQGVVMAIEDAIHAHVSDGVTLSHGAVLAVASAVHLQAAGAIDLTQATTIVVSDSVHAHIAQQINLLMPGGPVVPPGRTIVVQARSRVIVIQPESRTSRVH